MKSGISIERKKLTERCNDLSEELRVLAAKEKMVDSFEQWLRCKTEMQKAVVLDQIKSQVQKTNFVF